MKQALLVAAICEFGGSVLMGAGVVGTIRKGIADIVSKQKAAILTADRAAPADLASLAGAFGKR